jgi:hypothetical protein
VIVGRGSNRKTARSEVCGCHGRTESETESVDVQDRCRKGAVEGIWAKYKGRAGRVMFENRSGRCTQVCCGDGSC